MSNNKAWEKTDFTDRFSKTGKNRSLLRMSCFILCLMACLSLTGCKKDDLVDAKRKAFANAEHHGMIACSSKKEADIVYAITEGLLDAKKTGDTDYLYSEFSEYAKTSPFLKDNLKELIRTIPDAEMTYDGVMDSTGSYDRGVEEEILYPSIYFFQKGEEKFRIRMVIYMKNDTEKEKEGLHLIQFENLSGGKDTNTPWPSESDVPGIYIIGE